MNYLSQVPNMTVRGLVTRSFSSISGKGYRASLNWPWILFTHFLVRFSFLLVQKFLSIILGVGSKWKDVIDGKETKLTAQVLYNWYTMPFTFELYSTRHNFITTHERFAPARTVLRQNVQLLSITEDVAIYIEMDPSIEPFNIRQNPILFMVQTLNVRKLIFLPRRLFEELMNEIDIEDREVVWLFHSARCGSTLWAQIFYTLPNWTVISETQVSLHSLIHDGTVNDVEAYSKSAEYENMVVAFIKSYLRLVPAGNSVFWKAQGVLTEHMIPIINKRFPKHKIMFAYRDILPSAKSYQRFLGPNIFYEQRFKQVKADIDNEAPIGRSRFGRLFFTSGCDIKACTKAIKDSDLQPYVFEWFVLQWAARMRIMMRHQSNGISLKCIKYDDLNRDTKGTISKVFSYLGISLDAVDLAAKAIEQDSQAGLVFSKENRVKDQGWTRTDEAVERCNIVLTSFGFTDLNAKVTMKDTI